MQLVVWMAFLAAWMAYSLIVFRAQRRALAEMRASDLIPFSSKSVLFSCALLGLLMALGTMVVGTFVWHQFLG